MLVVFAVAGASLVGRLAWWQVVRGSALAAEAHRQTTIRTESPSRRGTIFDRSGTVVLATSVDRYRIVGSPHQLTLADRQATAQGLVNLLGLAEADAVDLVTKMTSDRGYVVLARGVDEAVATRIRDMIARRELQAISLEPEPQRVYPLAEHRERPSPPTCWVSSIAMGKASTASRTIFRRSWPASPVSSSPSATPTATRSPTRSRSNRRASRAPTCD